MDLYDVYRPMYIKSKILCLAPFAFVSDKSGRGYRESSITLAYSITASCLFIVAFWIEICTREDQVFSVNISVFQLAGTVMSFSVLVTFYTTLASSSINERKCMNLLNEMCSIRHVIGDENLETKQNFIRIMLLMILAEDGVHLAGHLNTIVREPSWSFIYLYMFYLISEMINYTTELQFVSVALLIGHLFECLSKKLLKLTHALESSQDGGSEEMAAIVELRNVSKIQTRLVALCELANSVYRLPVLMNVGRSVFAAVFTLFGFFTMIFEERSKSPYWNIPAANLVIATVLTASRVLMVTATCHIVASKSDTLALPLSRQSIVTKNPRIKIELRGLSLQLLSNKMSLGCLGFFTIDLALLYSIVGCVTTYLVIVIQFHLASDRKI